MVRRRLAAALTGDTAEHLLQQVEDLLLQMDPLQTRGRGTKRRRSMADFLPQTVSDDDLAQDIWGHA